MQRLAPWLLPGVALGLGVWALALGGLFLEDPARPFQIGNVGSVQFVLNTNAAALTSAMSVLIALVLLSVQLTAQRYSFNIIDIFIHNWVNAALIGFFILTITFNLWLGLTLSEDFIPDGGIILALVMMTVCFGLLPAYIAYLFDVLRPDNILNFLQRQFTKAIDISEGSRNLAQRRAAASGRINQIGDIARTAVNLLDSAVARHSVWVLYWSIVRYLEEKSKLPAEWFAVEEHHFRGRHELIKQEIEQGQSWLERQMLDEVREVFYATLNKQHDINNTVAVVVRLLGEKAIEVDDPALIRMVMKFFNTFLRAAITQGDTRAGYHVLYQYRLLADTALDSHPDVAREIADRLSYYGDAAASGPMLWMSVGAAYDLRILAETCYERGMDRTITAKMVEEVVESVHRAEAKRSPALPELHKTVAALGSFFLVRGEREFVRELRAALDGLPDEALERIHRALTTVEDPVFWELTDRVVNFDYVEPDVRAALPAFLAGAETWSPPASKPPPIPGAEAPALSS